MKGGFLGLCGRSSRSEPSPSLTGSPSFAAAAEKDSDTSKESVEKKSEERKPAGAKKKTNHDYIFAKVGFVAVRVPQVDDKTWKRSGHICAVLKQRQPKLPVTGSVAAAA